MSLNQFYLQTMGESICQRRFKPKKECHEFIIPRNPEQNRVAERMNRTLLESARAMIAYACLPNGYWAEAVLTAAYLRNRTTSTFQEDKMPYEMWYERKPDVSHLRVFGCITYAHIRTRL